MEMKSHSPGTESVATDPGSHLKAGYSELKSRASDGIDEAASAVGRTIVSAATAADTATHEAAAGLQKAGRYMQNASPEAMAQDLWKVARAHPAAWLLLGLGMGVVAARIFPSFRRHA